MQQRAREALQTACQSVGIKGLAGCPLTLNMHGSCGGAKLQVGAHDMLFSQCLGRTCCGSCGGCGLPHSAAHTLLSCLLQVAVGLRSQGFVRRFEVWWGPSASTQPWQATDDGALIAVRVSFTGDKEPEVSSEQRGGAPARRKQPTINTAPLETGSGERVRDHTFMCLLPAGLWQRDTHLCHVPAPGVQL